MKILYLFDFCPFKEDQDGLSKIYYNVMKQLSPSNDVDVMITKRHSQCPKNFFNVKNIFYEPYENTGFQRRLNQLICNYSLAFPKKVLRHLFHKYDMKKYDIIHTAQYSFIHLGLFHEHVILGLNDSLSLMVKESGMFNTIRKIYYKRIERNIARAKGWLYVVAPLDAHQYRSEKILILPNGIDTEKYRPIDLPKKVEKSLVFHGILDFQPNIVSIRKMSEVLKNELGSDYKLYLVGRLNRSGSCLQDLYGDLDNVVHIGEVDNISSEISKYEAYLILMQSGSGIKNKLLEALSTGCTVITNPKAMNGLSHLKELKKAVYVVEKDGDLKHAILDKENWPEKKQKAREYALRFHSWQDHSLKLMEFYKSIAS